MAMNRTAQTPMGKMDDCSGIPDSSDSRKAWAPAKRQKTDPTLGEKSCYAHEMLMPDTSGRSPEHASFVARSG